MLTRLGHTSDERLDSYAVMELRSGFNQYLDSGLIDIFTPVSYTGLRALERSALNLDHQLLWPYGYFTHVHNVYKDESWLKVEPHVRIEYLWSWG